MKVLIITDSLSLPRRVGNDCVLYEETYPYLLKKRFPEHEFVCIGIGGGTIKDLFKQLGYYSILEPDFFFIQCGIVDCAPRIFKKWESLLIKKLRMTSIFKPFKDYIRRARNISYTSMSEFRNYSKNVVNLFKNTKTSVYAIGILPASQEYERILPRITERIIAYNKVLKEKFQFVSCDDFIPMEDILPDHHHLNANGHLKTFKKIAAIISNSQDGN